MSTFVVFPVYGGGLASSGARTSAGTMEVNEGINQFNRYMNANVLAEEYMPYTAIMQILHKAYGFMNRFIFVFTFHILWMLRQEWRALDVPVYANIIVGRN